MTKPGDEARARGLKSSQLCPVSLWVSSNTPPPPQQGSLDVSSKDLKHGQNSITHGLFSCASQILYKTSAGCKLGCPVHAKHSHSAIFHQHPHLCNLSVF